MENISNSNIKALIDYYLKKKNISIEKIIQYYNPVPGYIYCIHNEIYKFYNDELYKCGNALDVDKRLLHYTTPYPIPSQIMLTSELFFDKNLAESLLFAFLREYIFKPNREFFKCNIEIIRESFEKVKIFFQKYNTKESVIRFLINDDNYYIYFAKKNNNKVNYDIDKINITNIDIDKINITDIDIYNFIDNNQIENNKMLCIKELLLKLNLQSSNIINYKNIFTNKLIRQHYFNFIDLIQFNETENEKINIIKNLYSIHNIKFLSLNDFDKIDKINITNDKFKNIVKIFRSEKTIPKNNRQLKKFIIDLLRNLIGQLNILYVKRIRNDNNKKTIYLWNLDNINYYFELFKKSNTSITIENLF